MYEFPSASAAGIPVALRGTREGLGHDHRLLSIRPKAVAPASPGRSPERPSPKISRWSNALPALPWNDERILVGLVRRAVRAHGTRALNAEMSARKMIRFSSRVMPLRTKPLRGNGWSRDGRQGDCCPGDDLESRMFPPSGMPVRHPKDDCLSIRRSLSRAGLNPTATAYGSMPSPIRKC